MLQLGNISVVNREEVRRTPKASNCKAVPIVLMDLVEFPDKQAMVPAVGVAAHQPTHSGGSSEEAGG